MTSQKVKFLVILVCHRDSFPTMLNVISKCFLTIRIINFKKQQNVSSISTFFCFFFQPMKTLRSRDFFFLFLFLPIVKKHLLIPCYLNFPLNVFAF